MSHYTLPLCIALGGAAGSLCRYGMTILMSQMMGTTFPYGTWCVNALGSLLIGFLGFFLTKISPSPMAAALLITGFLGGFTTFSSFMNETLQFLLTGHYFTAFTYLACQLFTGLLFVFLGYFLANQVAVRLVG